MVFVLLAHAVGMDETTGDESQGYKVDHQGRGLLKLNESRQEHGQRHILREVSMDADGSSQPCVVGIP